MVMYYDLMKLTKELGMCYYSLCECKRSLLYHQEKYGNGQVVPCILTLRYSFRPIRPLQTRSSETLDYCHD